MSDEFGPSFITLTDEDGNDIELEYVDALEHEGQTYMAFFPAVEDEADEESEDYGLVILKSVTENGEELLKKFADECAEFASVDKNPKLDGRHMSMFLSPKTMK